ncbi:MAG: polysaccharide deacetylase family protein, partial [Gemmatimonadota bacterium]
PRREAAARARRALLDGLAAVAASLGVGGAAGRVAALAASLVPVPGMVASNVPGAGTAGRSA